MRKDYGAKKNAHPLVIVVAGIFFIAIASFFGYSDYRYLAHAVEADGKIVKFVRRGHTRDSYAAHIVFNTTDGQQISMESNWSHRLPFDLSLQLVGTRDRGIAMSFNPDEIPVENLNLHEKVLYFADTPKKAIVKPGITDFFVVIALIATGGLLISLGISQQRKRMKDAQRFN